MSSTGTLTGQPATTVSVVVRGCSSHRDTSVEVPPMSKVMTREWPTSRALRNAPTTPPAGPDSTVCTASCCARAADMTPPLERMTRSRAPCRDSDRLER